MSCARCGTPATSSSKRAPSAKLKLAQPCAALMSTLPGCVNQRRASAVPPMRGGRAPAGLPRAQLGAGERVDADQLQQPLLHQHVAGDERREARQRRTGHSGCVRRRT